MLPRLTRCVFDNLYDELTERPLLSTFRFVRLTRFVVTDVNNKLVEHTSDVFLCGQVLKYSRSRPVSLVDDIGVIVEPGSDYLCTVAIRSHVGEPRRVVVIPFSSFRAVQISRDEFMMGFLHGTRVTATPPPFAPAWADFLARGIVSDSNTVRARLGSVFAPLCGAPIIVDIGPAPIVFVRPSGFVSSIVPTAYACASSGSLAR